MKSNTHPKWHPEAQVVCACGNMFTVGSTKQSIRVEICHKCHPFFTGEMRYVDTMGRVERFQQKQKQAKAKIKASKKKTAKKKEEKREEEGPKTLKEMLMGLKK